MIRSIYFQPDCKQEYDLSTDRIAAIFATDAGLLWINLENPDQRRTDKSTSRISVIFTRLQLKTVRVRVTRPRR